MEIRPELNIEWNNLNAAFDVFYQGRLGSNFGAFPISSLGSGLLYYPSGLPIHTTLLDNGVIETENRFAPFILGQMTLTNIAITSSIGNQPISFNGLVVGFQAGGGGEIPVGQTWSILLEVFYQGTLAGGANSGASANVSFGGFCGLIGISIRP